MKLKGSFKRSEGTTLPRIATSLGFFCAQDDEGIWHIQPRMTPQSISPTSTAAWSLHQQADRWVLVVEGVPQILLHEQEAISFLKRCEQSQNPDSDTRGSM